MFLGRIIFKWLWLGLLIAGLVIAGVLWWFNSFLYTPTSLEAVRLYVSEKSGLPLQFERAGGNIVEGLRIHEGMVDIPGAPAPGRLLRLPILLFRFDLWWLPLNRLSLAEIKINNPDLTLQWVPNQSILWPTAEQASLAHGKGTADGQFLNWLRQASLDCESLNVDNGSLTIQSVQGIQSVKFTGIMGNLTNRSFSDQMSMSGRSTVDSVQLGPWKCTDWKSVVNYEPGTLKFSDFTATAYHGSLMGEIDQKVNDPQLPYTADVNLSKLDVNELFGKILGKVDTVSGQLSGSTTWRASIINPQDLSGKGSLTISDGQLIQVDFFQELSKALGVGSLAQPDYSKCRIDFTLENGIFNLSTLVINTVLFDFSASGIIGEDGVMDLSCELVCKPELVKSLSVGVTTLFPPDKDGDVTMKFHLKGTLDQTETDLWNQLVMPPSASPAKATVPTPPPTPAVPTPPAAGT